MSNEEREQIIDNLICEWGRDYLRENGYYDDEPFYMSKLNEIYSDVEKFAEDSFHGGRWGYEGEDDRFCPYDEGFVCGTYLQSIPDIGEYLLDMIDKDSFAEWAKGQSYIDTTELEEDDEE